MHLLQKKTEDEVFATIGKVEKNPIKGKPYFLAYPEDKHLLREGEHISCLLENFRDDISPEKGQVVKLHGVREYATGWRARFAEPVTLSTK